MKPSEMALLVEQMVETREDGDYTIPTKAAVEAARRLSAVLDEDYRAAPRTVKHLTPEQLAWLLDVASEYIFLIGK